jgi:ATP-dependent RNA helicase RhlE
MNLVNNESFEAFDLSRATLHALSTLGITTPTPIQAQSIPQALQGRDVIGIAQTGTGKTLAFAIPMVELLSEGDTGLVLAPTRELAQQIAETYNRLNVRTALVVGGAAMGPQIKALRSEPRVIIATPGRLIDLMNQGKARMQNVSIVVLDEADRMLDMGFAPSIRRILEACPRDRQTFCFSATMPSEIEDLVAHYLSNPARIDVAPAGSANELIQHEIVFTSFPEKHDILAELLYDNDGTILVFCRTRHGARKLASAIRKDGHTAAEIHSDRTLAQRREALAGFKSGQYRVLVATDIASRGIDVKEVSMVINFDIPECAEDYVHRIGRTGRAGAEGRAITIVLPEQTKGVREIERLMQMELPVSERSTVAPRNSTHRNRFPKTADRRQPRESLEVAEDRSKGIEEANPVNEATPIKTDSESSRRDIAKREPRRQQDHPMNDSGNREERASPSTRNNDDRGYRPQSDRPANGGNRGNQNYGDRPSHRNNDDRGYRPQSDRPAYGGNRGNQNYGDRPSTGNNDDRGYRPEADRPSYADRPKKTYEPGQARSANDQPKRRSSVDTERITPNKFGQTAPAKKKPAHKRKRNNDDRPAMVESNGPGRKHRGWSGKPKQQSSKFARNKRKG